MTGGKKRHFGRTVVHFDEQSKPYPEQFDVSGTACTIMFYVLVKYSNGHS